MSEFRRDIRGRGAGSDPANRFERTRVVTEAYDGEEFEERPRLKTEFIRDASKSIISENTSPDIPFRYSVNPYRGCEHGCAYCYARPTHEYLGYSAGLDFESKILVKEDAPRLLREALMKPSWAGESICLSGNTDCYQPAEREYQLTRGCLEVLAEFGNPVSIITKNALVTRDVDLYRELSGKDAALIYVSLTSLDDELCRDLEPRTSRPAARLRAVRILAEAGVPVGVAVSPVIPGLNDHEIPALLKAAADAGARFAAMTPLRLPLAVRPLFEEWLERFRPLRKDKVLANQRRVRGGQLNDARFGSRMRGEGATAEALRQLFNLQARRLGLNKDKFKLSGASFRRPPQIGDQISLL